MTAIALYPLLKAVHISFVAVSFTLFVVRARWSLQGSDAMSRPWVRVVPHINDSLLLLSAIALVVISGQYPLQQPWLTAKVGALLAYIGFGTLALKRARGLSRKVLFLVLALITFAYMVGAAITKSAALKIAS